MGTMQGHEYSKGMGKSKMGLQSLGQGSPGKGMEWGGLGRVGHAEF